MKNAGLPLMGVGALFVLFGLVDLIGSFQDFDLWSEMGIELPGFLWHYSAYIEIAIGAGLFSQGKRMLKGGAG